MNNTRQVLKLKINCSAEEVNKQLNDYLTSNQFIQTDYNGEKVLKLNNLYAKQSFYQTYIKIFLSNEEITIIGWINYKNAEYGFDDKINFEDLAYQGNWQPIRELYSIFFTIASNYKTNDNIYCEKLPVENIREPEYQNLFYPNITYEENKNYMKYSGAITLTIFSVIIYIISLTSSTNGAKYFVLHFLIYLFPLIFIPFSLKKVIKDRNADKTAKIIYIIDICIIIICVLSGLINTLVHL